MNTRTMSCSARVLFCKYVQLLCRVSVVFKTGLGSAQQANILNMKQGGMVQNGQKIILLLCLLSVNRRHLRYGNRRRMTSVTAASALAFFKNKHAIHRTDKAGAAGDRIQWVGVVHFSGVMDEQQCQSVLVCNLPQTVHITIVAGVEV